MLKKHKILLISIFIFILITILSLQLYSKFSPKKEGLESNKIITWNQNPTTQQEYEEALQKWKNQCLIKPGYYTGYEIRNKLGLSSKWIYSDNDSQIEGIYYGKLSPRKELEGIYKLYYQYNSGWFMDEWYLRKYSSDNDWSEWIMIGESENSVAKNHFPSY